MTPGDTVKLYSNATISGLPLLVGHGTLKRKIGTIPHYWEVEKLVEDGELKTLRFFVRPEDVIETADSPRRPSLRVIQGGVTNDI